MAKKIILFFLILILRLTSVAQIEPFYGITPFDSCKFETECLIVELDTSASNIWQIGTPSKLFFDSSYSAIKAVVTDTLYPYPDSTNSYFDVIITGFWFDGQYSPILGFKHKYQTDTLIDGGYIEVSDDNGQTWHNIINPEDIGPFPSFYRTENMYSSSDTLLGGVNGFSGTSNGWIYSRVQWGWWITKKANYDTLIARFHFISDSIQTNKDGWMIDNIEISRCLFWGSVQDNNSSSSMLSVYPNPLKESSIVTFENQTQENKNIVVLNSLGQILRRFDNIQSNQVEIKKDNLAKGYYLIQLQNEDGDVLHSSPLVVE